MDKKEYYKNYYENNKEEHKKRMETFRNDNPDKIKSYKKKYDSKDCVKEKHNISKKIIRDKRRLFLDDIKKECYCKKCGEKRWYVLDFHHIDPNTKLFNLGDSTKHSFKKILEETKKCIALCRNCHQEFHYLGVTLNEFGVEGL